MWSADEDGSFGVETYRSGGEEAHPAGCNEWRDERQTEHRGATEEELNFRPRDFGERVGDMQEVEQQQDPGEPEADHRDGAVELGYSGAAELAALNADEADQHEHLQNSNRMSPIPAPLTARISAYNTDAFDDSGHGVQI